MEDRFFKYWFSGLEKALQQSEPASRTKIFRECAKACSESYTKQVFKEEYEKSTGFHDFLKRLTNRFSGMQFTVAEEGRAYEVIYPTCACELFTQGLMRDGQLCECSKLSLLENLEALLGEGNVRVQLLESILRGDEHCKLRIELDPAEA